MLFRPYRRVFGMAPNACSWANDAMNCAVKPAALCRHAIDVLRRLDDALMPMRCVFCGTRTFAGGPRICCGCYSDLPWIKHACSLCGTPLEVALPPGVHCARCQKRPPLVEATVAPLLYAFPVDAGLKALKFGRRSYFAAAFAELLLEQMGRFSPDIEALLPVPLHWRRQAYRGFNQAAELSLPLAKRLDLPVVRGVVRRRATAFQSGLSQLERRVNLRHAFYVKKVSYRRHVLIVDDVVTTGETTRWLAAAMIDSGVKKVSVLAVARAALSTSPPKD